MKTSFFLALGFLLLVGCKDSEKNEESASSNDLSPIYSEEIPKVDFKTLQPLLHQENDTTYVINFWATWCKPCVEELPFFEMINEKYADEKLKVILVSLDFPDQLESRIIPFIKTRNIRSKVIFLDDGNANEWIPKVNTEWSGAIPATIIYNKKQRDFREGAFTYAELEEKVSLFLNEN